MISLSQAAQTHLDRYLSQIRLSLAGFPAVDADDVVRDIHAHIDAELGEVSQPVPLPELEAVLSRLGSPSQWVPAEEMPAWRRVLSRLRSGPEDWRLAYLSLGLLVLLPLFPPLVFVSFLLARAGLALAEERGEEVGAQRWLIYPPLLVIYVSLAAALLLWPAGAAGGGLAELWQAVDPSAVATDLDLFLAVAPWAVAALGLWWMILGGLAARRPGVFRVVFHPFLGRLEARHGWRLLALGLVLAAAGAALGIAFAPLPLAPLLS